MMAVQQRSIGLAIFLYFITCGLYAIYWMYVLTNEIGHLSGDSSFSGGKVILLSIITCGIYSLFWYYQLGKHIQQAQENKGVRASDESIIYLVLGIFGLGIVSMAIAQSNVNKLV
ncbi:MAG TPA: DUF4234 domain-containing protein [Bacillaceae bacterium]|nr:DUF4234 domain-containing protein [Bacillaceae bacterium]